MTGKTSNIRRAFDFLLEHAQERKPFSVEEFSTETEWSILETRERIVNRLSDLIYQEGEGFFAKPEILRVRLDDFKDLLDQKKRLFADYVLEVSSSILIYEFFMPLTREDRLREAEMQSNREFKKLVLLEFARVLSCPLIILKMKSGRWYLILLKVRLAVTRFTW